jgi:hypothetical protein
MNYKVLLVVLSFIGLVFSQNVVLYTIDSFEAPTPETALVQSQGAPPTETDIQFTVDGSIFGGERDCEIVVEKSAKSHVFTASVSGGQFLVSAGPGTTDVAYGVASYDGVDNSAALVTNGTFNDPNNDFTANGAFAIVVNVESDLNTTAEIYIYSGQTVNDYCSIVVAIPKGSVTTSVVANYTAFVKNGAGCDFTNVGAVELVINTASNIDALIDLFGTFGPGASSPSKTPTPTPSRSHNPCFCECPALHCVLDADPSGVNTAYFQTSDLHSGGGQVDHSTRTVTTTKNDSTVLSASLLLLALIIALLI